MAAQAKPRVAETGHRVQVHYTGRLADGKIFDSSVGSKPLDFVIGAGSMLQAFEKGIIGMKRKETRQIHIPAAQAYGEVHKDKIFPVSRQSLNISGQPKVGERIVLETPRGAMRTRVVSFNDKYIYLDANHILAGKDLDFEVELVSISENK